MPFEQRSFFYKKEIDIALMNKACKNIIGKKDFTSFSKANTQTHTNICEIYRAEWTYEKQMICFTIQANRFLRNILIYESCKNYTCNIMRWRRYKTLASIKS